MGQEMTGLEQVISRYGLAVRCHMCKCTGFIKPGTDYGGWYRVKLPNRSLWYCPEHSKEGEHRGTNPPLGSVARDPNDDLKDLMEAI